ncbi:MAG: ADP-ribosylglycohydrolase family protein, partial [bacterium]
ESRGDRPVAPTLIDETIDFIGECALTKNLRRAKNLLQEDVPTETALSKLGTSGYVVETVASAVYCFFRTPNDFEQTVSTAVLAGGDTDTTGAVAGAISGAWNGLDGIPSKWINGVEMSELIMETAEKIYDLSIT